MFQNNFIYLNFVTDLKRAALCMTRNNIKGAKIFLDHAQKIYKTELKDEIIDKKLHFDFESMWNSLYKSKLPRDAFHRQRHADKLITLSSIIFSRVTN